MTPDEIQALREKHRKGDYGQCEACDGDGWTPVGEYPCDVIKVLDAWEEREQATTDCDHWVGATAMGHYRYASSTPESLWDFTFCPKCGIKLKESTATGKNPTTHAFPVGAKVRLVNNNTMGKQWGTVAQQLINGQYLVENTWLMEKADPRENHELTYQICNAHQLRDIADEMTASDFEVGDKVCLWSQLHHAQNWLAVHEVVAITPTRIVVRPTASRDQSGEILTDPADWVLVPDDYDGEKIQ